MTTPPQPPVTPGPAEPYTLSNLMPATQPPVPPRRSRAGLVVGSLVAAATVVGLAVGAVLVVRADDAPTATTPAAGAPSPSCSLYGVDASTGAVVCKQPGAADVVNEGPAYDVPTKADFKLGIKVLKKECFGSAGCNIEFRLQVAYDRSFDPSKTYEVTYEIRGGDEPLQNTFEVRGSDATGEVEEFISTASSKSKLTAVVLDVAPRSY
jgi:hypothetical protein